MVCGIEAKGVWLSGEDLPKLFVNAEPGSIIGDGVRKRVRSWPNQTEITVSGVHFVHEDSGAEPGRGIAEWLGSP